MTLKFSRDRKREVLRICEIISKKHKRSSDKRYSSLMFFAGNYFSSFGEMEKAVELFETT